MSERNKPTDIFPKIANHIRGSARFLDARRPQSNLDFDDKDALIAKAAIYGVSKAGLVWFGATFYTGLNRTADAVSFYFRGVPFMEPDIFDKTAELVSQHPIETVSFGLALSVSLSTGYSLLSRNRKAI